MSILKYYCLHICHYVLISVMPNSNGSAYFERELNAGSLITSKDLSYVPRLAAILHILTTALPQILYGHEVDIPLEISKETVLQAHYMYTVSVMQRVVFLEVSVMLLF